MEKQLIYRPKNKAKMSRSSLYGIGVFGRIAALCTGYMFKAIRGQSSLAMIDQYINYFWRLNFKHTSTTLYAVGREHLQPRQTYVFISNHESWMDFSALFGTVPGSLRMVAKEGLMKIPIFGHAMHDAGFIAIDRKNRHKAVMQLENAKKRLKEGISIWIAPEGTRSRNDHIGEFKKGGFYLALDLKTPIVPVFIEGAAKVMPPDTLQVNTNKSITVHFLEPIDTTIYDRSNIGILVKKVRDAIIERQAQSQKDPQGS